MLSLWGGRLSPGKEWIRGRLPLKLFEYGFIGQPDGIKNMMSSKQVSTTIMQKLLFGISKLFLIIMKIESYI